MLFSVLLLLSATEPDIDKLTVKDAREISKKGYGKHLEELLHKAMQEIFFTASGGEAMCVDLVYKTDVELKYVETNLDQKGFKTKNQKGVAPSEWWLTACWY